VQENSLAVMTIMIPLQRGSIILIFDEQQQNLQNFWKMVVATCISKSTGGSMGS